MKVILDTDTVIAAGQIRRIKRHAHLVEPQERVTLLSDPDDDKFLELAKTGNVPGDYVVLRIGP